MEQETYFDKIDAYIWDLLPQIEKETFEQVLESDEDLQAEVALRRLENEALKLKTQDNLRDKMRAWRLEAAQTPVSENTETEVAEIKIIPLSQKREGAKIVRFSPMRWAAAAALFIGVFAFGKYWASSNLSDSVLVETYYNSSGSILRGERGSLNQSFDEAMLLMQKGDYQAAIPLLETLTDSATFVTTRFTLAEAFFKTKEFSKAISVYQTIVGRNETPVSVHGAEWKTVLTHIAAAHPKTDYLPSLQKIVADENHTFQKEASALLAKLNNPLRFLAN